MAQPKALIAAVLSYALGILVILTLMASIQPSHGLQITDAVLIRPEAQRSAEVTVPEPGLVSAITRRRLRRILRGV